MHDIAQHHGPGPLCFRTLTGAAPQLLKAPSNPGLQVESKCSVREPLPSPKQGSLPLPQDLDKAKWDQAPKSLEDLQPICEEHYPKLTAPQYPQQVCMHSLARVLSQWPVLFLCNAACLAQRMLCSGDNPLIHCIGLEASAASLDPEHLASFQDGQQVCMRFSGPALVAQG